MTFVVSLLSENALFSLLLSHGLMSKKKTNTREKLTCRMRMSGHGVSVKVYVSAGGVCAGTVQRRKKKGKKVEETFPFRWLRMFLLIVTVLH